MKIFKKIASALTPSSKPDEDFYTIYVRGHRCKEALSTRIYLRRDLSDQDDSGYIARKILAGTGRNRCFERVEVILYFDEQKNIVDQQISGGVFITAEEYESEKGDA